MNEVEIYNESGEEITEIEELRNVIEYAITYQHLSKLEFTIILVDNQKIHQLNKTYRGVDHPTDVISFALEDGEPMVTVGNRILGDIYISVPMARGQALSYGHSFTREICFLAIHGFLHLLGYDHIQEGDEKVMFKLQKEILDGYGIKR